MYSLRLGILFFFLYSLFYLFLFVIFSLPFSLCIFLKHRTTRFSPSIARSFAPLLSLKYIMHRCTRVWRNIVQSFPERCFNAFQQKFKRSRAMSMTWERERERERRKISKKYYAKFFHKEILFSKKFNSNIINKISSYWNKNTLWVDQKKKNFLSNPIENVIIWLEIKIKLPFNQLIIIHQSRLPLT